MRPLDALNLPLSGRSLIEASAGTGKTYAIATLYVRLIVEAKRSVREILVVTYTKAATAELRMRIRQRLSQCLSALQRGGDVTDDTLDAYVKGRLSAGGATADCERLRTAIVSFDQASIFTIHGFCQRVLQESAFESGASFDASFLNDESALLSEVSLDFWARELYPASADLVRYLMGKTAGVHYADLATVTLQATRHSYCPILPPVPPISDAELVSRWRTAQGAARSVWQEERGAIIACLENAGLNKSKYRPKDIREVWPVFMDRTLEERQVGIVAEFERFHRFTTHGLADGCNKHGLVPEHRFFALCDEVFAADQGLQQLKVGFFVRLAEYARLELSERKKKGGLQGFDDLLHRLGTALTKDNGTLLAAAIRKRFPAALIDEFQDTDPIQYDIFRTVYGEPALGTSLFLIGDPKQAIYGFRGADLFAYLTAKHDVGKDTYTLGVNWRSDPDLIRGVNALFERGNCPFVYKDISFEPVSSRPDAQTTLEGSLKNSPALEICFVSRAGLPKKHGRIAKKWAERNVPVYVAAQIKELLESDARIHGRAVRPGQIAVLVRTNRQGLMVQQALEATGRLAVLEGGSSVFDAPEARAFEHVLAAVANPANERGIATALASDLFRLTATQIDEVRGNDTLWQEWEARFRSWNALWVERGFIQALRHLLSDAEVNRRVLAHRGGERALTNIYHLAELLQEHSVKTKCGPEELLRWLERMRRDPAARSLAVGDSSELRLESDADAIKIVTIHKSKGLEYPFVFCPFAWDGRLGSKNDKSGFFFHDSDNGDALTLELGSTDRDWHQKLARAEEYAENLRLLYVALTRAKHKCWVLWGAFADSEQSALGYLLHRPMEVSMGDDRVEPDVLQEIAKTIAKKSDEILLSELQTLIADCGDAIGLIRYEKPSTPLVVGAQEPVRHEAYHAKHAHRVDYAKGRVASFTSLVHERNAGLEPLTVSEEPRGEDCPTGHGSGELVALWHFPRGARVGTMIHQILETVDFTGEDEAPLQEVADTSLVRFGLDRSFARPLATALHGALNTQLLCPATGAEMALCDVTRNQRIDEMEFLFPVSGSRGPIQPKELARLLQKHLGPWSPAYADGVEQLGFAPLRGFLRGFVDLVYCRGERWYVVDYKTNHLGDTVSDYESAHLRETMAQHHYFLQYLLYTVALHRYLSQRLVGYCYEKNIGGVFYLFLRGMAPHHAPQTGVFASLPPKALIEELSALLGTREGEIVG